MANAIDDNHDDDDDENDIWPFIDMHLNTNDDGGGGCGGWHLQQLK